MIKQIHHNNVKTAGSGLGILVAAPLIVCCFKSKKSSNKSFAYGLQSNCSGAELACVSHSESESYSVNRREACLMAEQRCKL